MVDPEKIVTIRAVSRQGARQWMVNVTTISPKDSHATSADILLHDPFTATQENDLLWALEQHPPNQPFQKQRARRVSRSLQNYSLHLFDQLGLAASPPGTSLRIDIEGDLGFQSLHWETLELFPGFVVRRKVQCRELLTHSSIISIASMAFRILVVVSHSMIAGGASGAKTGGHANPRLISRSIVEIAAEINAKRDSTGQGVGVHVEIVRQGTWNALNKHLERRGKRYFHLVHFDVHSRWDKKSDRPALAFVSDNSPRKRSWRSASEVSAVLSKHGVKIVVLNAPRTANASGVCDDNMAEFLVDNGIRAVVALPYKILNSGAHILMSTFYRSLLSSEVWDLGLALSEARIAMMNMNLRDGRFGVKVAIDDWIVPVLYHNGGTEVSVIGNGLDEGSPIAARTGRLRQKVSGLLRSTSTRNDLSEERGRGRGRGRGRLQGLKGGDISGVFLTRGEMVGRDGDIFDVETQFLIEKNILRITGAAGIGKSTFVIQLCWWWKSTSLIQDYFSFCFYQKPYLNVEMICRQIYLSLFQPADRPGKDRSTSRSMSRGRANPPRLRGGSQGVGAGMEMFPSGWMDATIEKLRRTPHMIVLDSLEFSEASVDGINYIKTEFIEFLNRLEGGRTLVVIVSNLQENWFSDSNIKLGTFVLRPLDMEKSIEQAISILQRQFGNKERFEGGENRAYLERLLNLVNRNSLVIELTFPNIFKHDESVRDVFISFLKGSSSLGTAEAGSIYAMKSMKLIADFICRLETESKMLLYCLAPFWSVIPKFLNSYLAKLLLHRVLPAKDSTRRSRIDYLGILSFESDRDSKPPLEQENLEETGWLERYQYIVSELLSLEFLYENPQIGGDLGQKEHYYGVHPLLTLFLRQMVTKDESEESELVDYSAIKQAFLDYYDHKALSWDQFAEEKADQDLRVEETNFLSAIFIALADRDSDRCFSLFPTQIFIRMAAASLVDSRPSSIVSLFAVVCEEIIKKANLLSSKKTSRPKPKESTAVIVLFSANWLTEYHAQKSGPAEFKMAAEMALSLVRVADKTSPRHTSVLVYLEEQAAKQKAHTAAKDGMVHGLRIGMPFNGLTSSEIVAGKSVASTKGEIWIHLARSFIKMRSIAVQSQLLLVLKPGIRSQIQKDMTLLWKDTIKTLKSTALEPLTHYFDWVPALLHSTPDHTTIQRIPSARFVAYPEFVRSQLNLLFGNPKSAKTHLLTGLDRSQKKCNPMSETLCHLLLCDLTYRSRSYEDCITHVNHIQSIQDALPAFEWTRDDHLAYAKITLRKALCHKNLGQWNQAIEALLVAGEIANFCAHSVLVYVVLRKLASIKRDTGAGEQTVAELMLQAIGMAYDNNRMKDSAVHDEQGVLLRAIFTALRVGKAQEENEEVVQRIAIKSHSDVDEVRLFLSDVMDAEKDISRDGTINKSTKGEVEREISALWKDAELALFGAGKERRRALVRWRQTKWEKGLGQ